MNLIIKQANHILELPFSSLFIDFINFPLLSCTIFLVSFLVATLTIFLFSMFQMFVRKNSQYQSRLLNVLYVLLSIFLELGILMNLLNIVFHVGNENYTVEPALYLLRSIQHTFMLLSAAAIGKKKLRRILNGSADT